MSTTTRTHHRCAVDECTNPVRADVEGWRDRWSVQVRTLDYSHAEASAVIEYAQGIGTDDGRLF